MMKKFIGILLSAVLMTSLALTGCGSASGDNTDEKLTGPQAVNNGRYSFTYNADDFTFFASGETSCDISYTNENVQAAGSNVISISIKSDTTYDAVLEQNMASHSVSNFDTTECYFGADGVTAYTCTTGALSSTGSELTTSDTLFAIPDGNDVILIVVFRTIGTDEGTETTIDDSISAMLDTFSLVTE